MLSECEYKLYKELVENFKTKKRYDFVIAEGFLPCIKNQSQTLKALIGLVKENGFLVSTCIDEFSHFYEDLRRFLGFLLTHSLDDFAQKVSVLKEAFSSHLKELKFVSRPVKDWVSDVILNPALDNNFLSLKECILLAQSIKPNIKLVGVNPCLSGNLSWYKNTQFSYAKAFVKAFDSKRHLLLDYEFEDFNRDVKKNQNLSTQLLKFRCTLAKLRDFKENKSVVIEVIKDIKQTNADLPNDFVSCLDEVIGLSSKSFNAFDVANMEIFAKKWGRGQQYIAFRKLK